MWAPMILTQRAGTTGPANNFDRIFAKNKAKDIDEAAQSVYNSNSTVEETDARTLDRKVQTQDSQ